LRISPSELNLLPKPFDFAGYYYNNAFVLIWEYDALLNFYTAYDLEKSEDGINFTKVNKTPITKLAVTETSGISFTDSIPQYGKKYWYRILGKTLFNESSPPSDTISVIAFKELLVGPEFKNNELLSDKKVILQWGFAEDEAWKLTGFDVLRSDRAIGPYKIIKENLDRDKRKYQYSEVKDINYFKIRAKGISGDYQDSSPAMVQPIDSVPPLPPSGLKGTIDTLGIVRLSWNKNTELDLKGYTVLRADRPRQEFTRLTKGEIQENKYLDTINLKTFNKNVFYKLIASDFRYNESQPSKIIVLERPTKIPPSSPIFSAYEVQGDTIHLKWVPSSSDNITKQIIYRKEINQGRENQWENIFETSDTNLSEFKHVNTVPNTKYTYTITALNQNGLESNPSPPISVTTQKRLLRPEVKGLYANVNREGKFIQLSWRYKEANIMEIQVFRKDENTEFSLYQVFAPKRKQFIDVQLTPNTVYTYGLKAVFRNGSVSEWNEIEVKY
ncbi:MAG: fibronectin type III domain-containing protein, partial [Bacteroidota bacterium]